MVDVFQSKGLTVLDVDGLKILKEYSKLERISKPLSCKASLCHCTSPGGQWPSSPKLPVLCSRTTEVEKTSEFGPTMTLEGCLFMILLPMAFDWVSILWAQLTSTIFESLTPCQIKPKISPWRLCSEKPVLCSTPKQQSQKSNQTTWNNVNKNPTT